MSLENYAGNIRKMRSQFLADQIAEYRLPIGDQEVLLNPLIGQHIAMNFTGQINCIYCNRLIKKSFNQGYCYPCFQRLARCDSCIIKPETCHYFQGTCREPEWADQHCMQHHIVYLANSSGIKVGITRGEQVPTRWVDQGAVQAMPIAKVSNRLQSGLVEVALKDYVSDKTNWRKMLKNDVEAVDLPSAAAELYHQSRESIEALQQQHGEDAIEWLNDADVITIDYPVLQYPSKVSSFNFDKNPEVAGQLQGIKGQYLILDTGVINLRKFAGYYITFSAHSSA